MRSAFHITIGSTSENHSFKDDLALVKSALLYADKITLCSPQSSELSRYLNLAAISAERKLEFLEAFASEFPQFIDTDVSEVFFRTLADHKERDRARAWSLRQYFFRRKLNKVVDKAFQPIHEKCLEIVDRFGMSPMLRLLELDILKIETIVDQNSFDYELAIQNFVRFLENSIINQKSYPLFNAQSANLIRLGIQANKIKTTPSGIARGKHSALAANLIERLPLFEEAEVDEILDIKRELERPLIRFRSSMLKFSESIKTAAWDKDFASDADAVFIRDVEPAILDIEDSVKSNSFLAILGRKAVEKPIHLATGSVFSILMSQLNDLPEIVNLSLGAGVASGTALYDSYHEWRQSNLKTEQNGLFFYYKAREKFSNL